MEPPMDSLEEIDLLLEQWRREVYGNSSANPVVLLTKIADLIERETEVYLKLPIDPFDDRHPSRTSPDCTLGLLLKALFKNESFMTQLTTDYITSRANFDLHVVSCRLLLDILPGLDSGVVFMETETLVKQLLDWAEKAEFPLNYHATGLLGAAMRVPPISELYREQNNQLVPIILNRLNQITQRAPDHTPKGVKRPYPDLDDCSSSSWAEAYMSGSYQMHPLSIVMQQRFILQYLSALGDYQELLEHLFEHKILSCILHFIDGRKIKDIRLAFDALKFLAAFLTHKKFALVFLDHGGLTELLRVNRHGMASSGVSLCLYYLAYNQDVMEKICYMEREIVEKMVAYGLWLLECSHDSSRAYAALFFSLCFQFPLLLRLFDKGNGLRKLLNVISMRGIFSDDPMINELTDDELYCRRQTTKQICIALREYARAHFITETKKCSRLNTQNNDQECKPTSLSDEEVMSAVETHRQEPMPRYNWRALDKMVQEDGVKYLLKVVAHICSEGIIFAGKFDTVRSILDILVVCSLSPRVQGLLLKEVIRINNPFPRDHPAIRIIMMCTDPKILDLGGCQKSALNILINFVCSNNPTRVPAPSLETPGSARKKGHSRVDTTLGLRKAIWANYGTLFLPKLIKVTSPETEADTIRALACRVLCGLAKEESIRQILSKLPLLDEILTLTKKPILQEKRNEHTFFCKYCKELIKLVTGISVKLESGVELSMADIKRSRIVAQTKIEFDKSQLYHLIHRQLISDGFSKAASWLYKEADLASHPINESTCPTLSRVPAISPTSIDITPNHKHNPINPNSPGPVYFKQTVKTPLDSAIKNKQRSSVQLSHIDKVLNEPSAIKIDLDHMIKEYLRNQHSLCKNPVAICPPFDLLTPHRCPEPTNRLLAPRNITSRIIKRKAFPPKGGMYGAKFDRHYIYSKFRPLRLVRDTVDLRTSSTCCSFSTDGQFLFIGTDGGMLKAFNISSGLVEASYECHMNEIGFIQASHDDNLILTTSPDTPAPQCILWTFTDVFERKHRFDNDLHAEFGKATSERIITTQESFCRLWDTATGSLIQKYEGHHRYSCNRATLNYSDTLVLNDGVLWDVRNSTPIHKFDKFDGIINGIFHPNGNEIIYNSQVLDVRNFQLLKNVEEFDMCQLKFNSTGDVIFSITLDDQSEVITKNKNEFRTSFRTFDSHDYSTIATIDLKRTISDLAVSSGDEHIALIESSGNSRLFHPEEYSASDLNVCRLYEIGRPRYDADVDLSDDEDEEDADDEENDDEEDDDDDDPAGLDFDEDEEEFDENDYDTDETAEDIVDIDDISGDSRLSTSNSATSRDELVPFDFQQSSDMDDEEDGSMSGEDDDDPSYHL